MKPQPAIQQGELPLPASARTTTAGDERQLDRGRFEGQRTHTVGAGEASGSADVIERRTA